MMMTDAMAQHLGSIGVPKDGPLFDEHIRTCGYHRCRALAGVERVHARDLMPGDILTLLPEHPEMAEGHARVVEVAGPYLAGMLPGGRDYRYSWAVTLRLPDGQEAQTVASDMVFLRVRSVADGWV